MQSAGNSQAKNNAFRMKLNVNSISVLFGMKINMSDKTDLPGG